MKCCVDVDYRAAEVATACLGFDGWADPLARIELLVRTPGAPPPYQPGAFYTRELPYVLAALARMPALELVIVDAYVWLGADHPGLGKYVADAAGVPVIGLAKTRYAGAPAVELVRGDSASPLYVTAIGLAAEVAAAHVRAMHGPFRIPTLIKRADTIARGAP